MATQNGLRIAIFVHCYFPEHYFGTEAYARSIAHEFAALGHKPFIVTATLAGEAGQASFVEQGEYEGIPVFRIDRNVRPNAHVRETFELPDLRGVHERILRKIKPDLVHVCHLISHTTALLDAARALSIPLFATFTDFFGFCFNNTLQTSKGDLCLGPSPSRANCLGCGLSKIAHASPALRILENTLFLKAPILSSLARFPVLGARWRADIEAMVERPSVLQRSYSAFAGAIAPSLHLRDAYRRNGFEGVLELSRFGIDIDRSIKPPRPAGALRVGFIGQLFPHKGVHLLLKALALVEPGKVRLDIWGNEKQDPHYAIELRRLAAGTDTVFRGTFPVREIAMVLRGIDVLVIPSLWFENSPMILLQALATHTPVIVSDVEGMSEFVTPGISGFTFKRNDVASLAQVLRRFADDPALAERMSCVTDYDRDSRAMAEDILLVYHRAGIQSRAAAA